jgi:uncharacterized membrane protein
MNTETESSEDIICNIIQEFFGMVSVYDDLSFYKPLLTKQMQLRFIFLFA